MGFGKLKREKIHKKCDGNCAYCGEKLPYKKMQVDHLIPKSNFQYHVIDARERVPDFLKHLNSEEVNHIDNLFPSCRYCNRFKDNFNLEEFRNQLSLQLQRAEFSSSNFRRALRFNQVVKTPNKIVFYFEKMKDRKYVFDGEKHVLSFDSVQDRWFLRWVVLKRQFRILQNNISQLLEDIKKLREDNLKLQDAESLKIRERSLELFSQNQKPKRKKNKKSRYKGGTRKRK